MSRRSRVRAAVGVLLWALLWLPRVQASPSMQEAEPSGFRVEPLTRTWGPVNTADLAGRFAYVGQARRLVVYDVQRPEAPRPRGQTEALSTSLREIKVEEGIAYAIDFGNAFYVFDVRDPDRPALLAELEIRVDNPTFPVGALRLFVHDGVADLLMELNRWWILDVSDPSRPRVVEKLRSSGLGSLRDPGAAQRVGDRMYVVDRGGSLHVFDVSDPFTPLPLGRASGTRGPIRQEGGMRPGGVVVTGNEAITLSGWNSLYTFDVSEPISPTRMGQYGGFGHDAGGLVRLGDLAIVTDGEIRHSSYVDLRRLPSPVLAGRGPAAVSVAADGDRAILVSGGRMRTSTSQWDWEDPNFGAACLPQDGDPEVPLGAVVLEHEGDALRTKGTIDTVPFVAAFAQAGTRIFAAVGRRGVVALDGSDPVTPRLFDEPQLRLRFAPRAIDADDRWLVVAAGRELCVFDHRAGWPPQLHGALWLGSDGAPTAAAVHLEDEVAWVASQGSLRAIDVGTRPPRELGAMTIPEDVSTMAVVSSDLVLPDPSGGLIIIDITDPAAPRAKETVAFASRVVSMAAQGRMLYLSNGIELLAARLRLDGELEFLGAIDILRVGLQTLVAHGATVFVGDADGLRVIDASVPSALDEVGRLEGWPAERVALHEDGRHLLLTGHRFGGYREPAGLLSARFDPRPTGSPDASRPTPTDFATPTATPTPHSTPTAPATGTPTASSVPTAVPSATLDPGAQPSVPPPSSIWLPWLLRVVE